MDTSQNLLTRIRYRVDEASARRFSNAELLSYADDAQKEVARKLMLTNQWYLGVVVNLSYVADQKSYALPERTIRVLGLLRTDTDPDKVKPRVEHDVEPWVQYLLLR